MGLRPSARRARTRGCIAGAALALAVATATRPVLAKEHAAGCAALPVVVERLRNALGVAAIHRARGSGFAAYVVLRSTARSVAGPAATPKPEACGALVRPLEQSLGRAEQASTAGDAMLELELGYTGTLALALTGRLPRPEAPPRPPSVPVSTIYGAGCPDAFSLMRRLESGVGSAAARARAVIDDLTRARQPRCAAIRSALEAAKTEDLAYTIDTILLDERAPDAAAETVPAQDSPADRCPELPIILQQIGGAIATGAPLYNQGEHEACRDVYQSVSTTIATSTIPPGRCPFVRVQLAGALRTARSAGSASDAAWALRRAFDRITGTEEQ